MDIGQIILNSFYDLNLQTKFDKIFTKYIKTKNNFQKALKCTDLLMKIIII